MLKCGDCLISGLTFVSFFIVFLLSVTHGGFKCEITTEGTVAECPFSALNMTDQEACDGTVFKTYYSKPDLSLEIICPWAVGTLTMTMIGVGLAITFTILAVLHRADKISLKTTLKKKAGIAVIFLLIIAMILMVVDIGTGGKRCKEFHEEMKDADVKPRCTNMVYGMTLLTAFLATMAFGYQVYQQQESADVRNYDINEMYVRKENEDQPTKYFSVPSN